MYLKHTMKPSKLLYPLLLPIVSLCVRRGIKLQEFLEVAKRAFVDAAQRELTASAERVNVSRVAVMTGLQRSDVTRLQKVSAEPPYSINLITRIIGQWRHDKNFSTKGSPKPLQIKGNTPLSFSQLVMSISKDVNPATVLFELERLGAVVKKRGIVELNSEGFTPTLEQEEDAFKLLGADISDLTNGVEGNLARTSTEPNLHITTRYDNVVVSEVPQVRKWLLKKGSEFQSQVRAYVSKFDKDLNPSLFESEGGATVTVGTFSVTSNRTIEMGDDKDVIK